MSALTYTSRVVDVAPRDEGSLRLVLPRGHLPATVRLAIPLDDEELYELCRRYADLRIERNAEGTLIIMSPTGGETGRANFRLTTRFGVWVEQDGSGVGFDSSTGFRLPNGAERAPDVAWVRKERWEALTDEERRRFPPLCPDFVVELRSPSDDLGELKMKMQEYIDNGAALGWLIDPEDRRVYVYRPGARVEQLDDPERVRGEPVLCGFELELAAIW